MAFIRFDFGSNLNDGSSRIATELEDKIDNLMSRFDMNNSDFFNQIIPHVTGFFISSSNIIRMPEKLTTELGRTIIKFSNFFFRFELDNYAQSLLKGNTLMIKGNLIFKKDQYGNNVFDVEVRNFYLTDYRAQQQTYEKYYSGIADFRNKTKPQFNPNNGTNIITLNLPLPENLPYIVDPTAFKDFVESWQEYLEFEKAITINSIKWLPIENEIKYNTVCELTDNATNRFYYEKHILKEGYGNLYIDSSNEKLSGNETQYTLLTIKVKRQDFDNIDFNEQVIRKFAQQQLTIIGSTELKKLIDLLDELKKSYEDRKSGGKELPEIKGFEIDIAFPPKITNSNVIFYFLVTDEKSYNKKGDCESEINRLGNELYIANIASGDIALYSRGKMALDKLETGDVKNPYLAGLLIEPEKFEQKIDFYNENNVDFALKNLNTSQKQAIIKCLNSNSIFCLQGPPGTGKTQTITELVYQYNKMGKKVLLSSQTHIAIDNVIERLPKELNILPLRLVRDRSKANAQYLPEKLLDNLYDAAYHKYTGKIDEYNHYEKNINDLLQAFENNKSRYEIIEKRIEAIKTEESNYYNLIQQLSELRSKENTFNSEIKGVTKLHNLFSEYYRTQLPFEAILPEFIYDTLLPDLNNLAKKYGIVIEQDFYNYAVLFKRIAGKTKVKHLKKLLEGKDKPQELVDLENEISKINEAIQTTEKLGLSSNNLRSEISKKLQQKKELDRKNENSKTTFLTINSEEFHFNKNQSLSPKQKVEEELRTIETFVNDYNKILSITFTNEKYDSLNIEKNHIQAKLNKIEDEISRIEVRCAITKQSIEEKNNPIKSERRILAEYFNNFYLTKLNGASLPETEVQKFTQIKEYIDTETTKFKQFRTDFIKLQPIYESLSYYLEKRDDFVKLQRSKFTNTLLKNNANVFGITCTSSPFFRSSTISGADNKNKNNHNEVLNIEVEDVDIRRVDFDVVIIDEVSKATPIEMIIPIIYGKSVILVGDQRQLPPIFKYRDAMFDGYSEQSKNTLLQGKTLNDYKTMVEHSLFEEIFNKLNHNKAILKQQYRFNENIMRCVNVFYDNELQLGAGAEQNNKKQHYLDVSIPNIKGGQTPIFCRNNYTYWFDSHLWDDGSVAYAELQEGETSYRNLLEVKITVEILMLLENGYGELKKNNPEEYKMAADDGIKPTVAVISMYGKHISSLKRELENRKMKINSFKNIKLDISTVDNYQGKEQDIIILNMVANNKSGRPGEFLQKFNRINVAISRSRTMLIMVGSSSFYNSISINVPKMVDGNDNFINAYYRIYEQCQSKWMAVADILNIKKGEVK